ncbi:MAG TPA: hypothetical protein VMR95_01675 [Candidatus Binatia bacterium]|nr:hypothetical protein [Candidatus Binatia bacterium]
MPEPDTKNPDNQFTAASPNPDELPTAFSLLKPSWQAIKLNGITLIEFVAIPLLLSLASLVIMNKTNRAFSGAQLLHLVPTIVSLILGPGLIYTLLQGAKGKSVDFMPALTMGLSFFWRFLAVAIVTTLIIVIGFCLLIVTWHLYAKAILPGTILSDRQKP